MPNNKLAKSKKSTKKVASESLSLQRTSSVTKSKLGGAMSVGSQNVLSEPSFPAPFNVSSGGSKPTKRVKKVSDPSKPKKKLSAYNLFVRSEMPKLKDVAPKDRMKKLGEMWKESKK